MATLGQNPNYRGLASAAAAELGTSSPSIIAAILGQWQCEQPPNRWPPVHNNPGFVTIGALRSVNVTLGAYARTSPGINFLAAFGSPGEGASAYAQLLARGRRYAGVRADVAAGDGAAYLQAVTSAGYGTRHSCAIGAYKALGGKVAPSAAPSGATGAAAAGRTEAEYYARIASIGIPTNPDHVITAEEAARMATELYGVDPRAIAKALTGRTNAELAATYVKGETIPTGPLAEIPRDLAAVAAGISAGIVEGVGQGVFSLVVLGGIVVLGLMGIRRLTG